MSGITHGVGRPEEFGNGVAAVTSSDVESVSDRPAVFDASAGDDWGSVLAVAFLIVGLIVGVLLLGGG